MQIPRYNGTHDTMRWEYRWCPVLSLNNSQFGDFVDRIHPNGLEIKNTSDTARSASYFDLHFEIDSAGRIRTKHDDKRNDFNFHIVNFPFKYVATFQQRLHMKYHSLGWSDIPVLLVHIMISLIECCYFQGCDWTMNS